MPGTKAQEDIYFPETPNDSATDLSLSSELICRLPQTMLTNATEDFHMAFPLRMNEIRRTPRRNIMLRHKNLVN